MRAAGGPGRRVLKLRRATVLEAGPGDGPEQDLVVELDGRPRPAIADVALVGAPRWATS